MDDAAGLGTKWSYGCTRVMYGLLLDKKTQGHLYAVILFLIGSALIYCILQPV